MSANPYSHSRTEQEYADPTYADSDTSAYAVPDALQGNSPYNDEFGWSAHPAMQPGNTPDPYRLGNQPLREHYPNGGDPPEEYYGGLDAEKKARHSVEKQIADEGWQENKAYAGYPDPYAGADRWAHNPRRIPPKESRVTQLLSPANYSFTRPFGWGLPKLSRKPNATGEHFSMADHRRNYEILGMQPPRQWRNTYRLDPIPWDQNVVDVPVTVQPQNGQIVASDFNPLTSRSWRLE